MTGHFIVRENDITEIRTTQMSGRIFGKKARYALHIELSLGWGGRKMVPHCSPQLM